MTNPQQPGGWPDQSWPSQQPYADPSQPASGAPASPAGYQAGYQAGYPAQAYPAQAYPAYGYGTPAVAVPAQSTNGLAIASLVCSLAGLFTCGVTSLVGAILGHVARRQIRERGEGGDGLALAGVITGWIITVLALLGVAAYVVFVIILVSSTNSTTYSPTPFPS
jgi:Domain of unknown function (DUF4190)